MKYKTCPNCGGHLDFGERCDCQKAQGTKEIEKDGEKFDGDKAVGV